MGNVPETLTLPPRTVCGEGAVPGLLPECRRFGRRGILVHGKSLAANGTLSRILAGAPADLDVSTWQAGGTEPTLDDLERLLAFARERRPEWLAGVGGGSVLDVAKAGAGLLDAPLPAEAYHDGKPVPESRIPFVAVPSTAGTGSEATIVTVLTNSRTGVKKSFRHASFMARVVMLDPCLLETCPPEVIAASGMDAFTQAVESFLSIHATWFTEELSIKGMELISAGLPTAFEGRTGNPLRSLAEGSYLAGLALSNARLGVVHGLAHPLGSRYHQPHGLVCAVCLPHALAFNRETCAAKYARMAETLGRDVTGAAESLLEQLRIKSPFTGATLQDRQAVIEETLASGSTKANPRPVTASDVGRLLDAIFHA